jgi:glycosyltransferase involved in cell wall biosynthesis
VNLASGLTGRQHQVEFFVYYPQYDFFVPTLDKIGIPIHKWGKRNRFSADVILALWRQIRKGDYDVVLSFLDTPNFYAELASFGMRRPVLVVSERNTYPAGRPGFLQRLLKQLHRQAKHIVTNTWCQATLMLEFAPWMRERLTVIYNGVDLDRFQPTKTLHRYKRMLLCVGSIIPRKNAVGLAHALVEYKRRYGETPSIHWAGAPVPKTASQGEFNQVNVLLEAHNLDRKWTWLGERRDMDTLYSQYAALIHPSFREGLPNAVCEAAACGLPVLVSSVGDHARLIRHGENGMIFDPNDPVGIMNAIHDFFELEESIRISMGQEARLLAEREFSFERFIDQYESLFYSLIL